MVQSKERFYPPKVQYKRIDVSPMYAVKNRFESRWKISQWAMMRDLREYNWNCWKAYAMPQSKESKQGATWQHHQNRDIPKPSNYRTIVLISHASNILLKIIQQWLQNVIDGSLMRYKLALERGKAFKIILLTSDGLWKRPGNIKRSYSCFNLSYSL